MPTLRPCTFASGLPMVVFERMAARRILKYRTSLVAYTDILGFGELIKNETPGKISKILRVFKEKHQAKDFFGSSLKGKVRIRHFVNFSDLCIVTSRLKYPNTLADASIVFELFSLAMAQETLLRMHRVILRGGVTIGLARTSRGVIYGPGIIEAYKMESKEARYPRILVSENVMVELARCARDRPGGVSLKSGEMLLAKDLDGKMFLDYLGVMKKLHPEDMGRVLAAHRRFAERGLSKMPDHREKYEWLMRYQQRVEAMPSGLQ